MAFFRRKKLIEEADEAVLSADVFIPQMPLKLTGAQGGFFNENRRDVGRRRRIPLGCVIEVKSGKKESYQEWKRDERKKRHAFRLQHSALKNEGSTAGMNLAESFQSKTINVNESCRSLVVESVCFGVCGKLFIVE